MNKVTKDNKGFSLVELIVVVLIMGILAVALTPQVLKWVNNSRLSSDNNTLQALVTATQTALTDPDAYKVVHGTGTNDAKVMKTYAIKGKSGNTVTAKDSCAITTTLGSDKLDTRVKEYAGISDLSDFKVKATDYSIVVYVYGNGKVVGQYQNSSGAEFNIESEINK